MTRPPTVDRELIRQVMSAETPRITAAEGAAIISEMIGKPVSVALIKTAMSRNPQWNLPPSGGSGDKPAMDYLCERAFGTVLKRHKRSYDWYALTAYERIEAGLMAPEGKLADSARRYVEHRLRTGQVTDYNDSTGFHIRPALPWEKDAGSYLRLPAPDYAGLEMQTALLDPQLLPEVREYWEDWLSMDRAARGRPVPRGRG